MQINITRFKTNWIHWKLKHWNNPYAREQLVFDSAHRIHIYEMQSGIIFIFYSLRCDHKLWWSFICAIQTHAQPHTHTQIHNVKAGKCKIFSFRFVSLYILCSIFMTFFIILSDVFLSRIAPGMLLPAAAGCCCLPHVCYLAHARSITASPRLCFSFGSYATHSVSTCDWHQCATNCWFSW